MDGTEPLTAQQLNAPPGGDPEPILLVIHRHNPLGPSALSEEGIKTVEAADIKDAHPAEVLGENRDAVAMIARGAGRVDALSTVQRERVNQNGTASTAA